MFPLVAAAAAAWFLSGCASTEHKPDNIDARTQYFPISINKEDVYHSAASLRSYAQTRGIPNDGKDIFVLTDPREVAWAEKMYYKTVHHEDVEVLDVFPGVAKILLSTDLIGALLMANGYPINDSGHIEGIRATFDGRWGGYIDGWALNDSGSIPKEYVFDVAGKKYVAVPGVIRDILNKAERR